MLGNLTFKSYSELEAKLHRVLGIEDAGRGTSNAMEEDVSDMGYSPQSSPAPDRETAEPAQDLPVAENPNVSEASTDDADLDYFKKLAETA